MTEGRGERPESADSPDAAEGDAGAEELPPTERSWFCDLCGAEMINRHCKLACPQCGYQRDCSDP